MSSSSSIDSQTGPIQVERGSGFWKKYLGWICETSVEPTMWLYMMAYMMTSIVEQAYAVDKACRVDHGFSQDVCNNLSANSALQAEVQITVSTFYQWNNIAGQTAPIILTLFFGNWSDRRGRKSPLVIALIGKIIYSGMVVVNSLMDDWSVFSLAYTATLPMALLGSDVAIFASCFAYISDVSSVEQRTFRVAILDAVYLSTMPIGVALGSFVFSNVVNSSYTSMFIINTTLLVLALIYSIAKLEMRTTPEQKAMEKGTNPLMDFFDKEHVIATVKTFIKPRRERRRLYLWILMLAMAFYTFQRNERQMSYLYTALIFSWDVTTFSHFRTFQSSLFVIAMLFGIPLMSKLFGMRDTTIIAIGALSHASGRIFYATATDPIYFYAGAVVAALGPIVAPVLRSMTSKVVPTAERGKVFALLSACDNAVPLFSGTLYSQLYNATITTAPNMIYWFTFATQITVLMLIMVIHFTLGTNRLGNRCEENGKNGPFKDNETNSPSQTIEEIE